MKKFILTPILVSLATFASAAPIDLPTNIIGGGTEFLEVNPASPTGLTTVYKGEGGYAGIEGGTISYTYAPTSANTSVTMWQFYDDFRIKNTYAIDFQGTSWATSTNAAFQVNNGATLIIDDLYVTTTDVYNASRTCFKGTTTDQAVVYLTARTNAQGVQSINRSTLYVDYTDLHLTGAFECGMMYLYRGANVFLDGNLTVKSGFYMQPGSTRDVTINLNGYDYWGQGTFTSEDRNNPNSTLKVTFGDDKDGDGKVIFAQQNVNATGSNTQIYNTKIVFTDYNSDTDLVLFHIDLRNYDLVDSLLVFEGYEGYEIQVEKVTYKGDSNWYSYFVVIPEPSTYAAILGALTLGLAIYRRRK